MTDCISGYISVGNRQLHYLQTGSGNKLLIAFHGYGNTAAIFSDLCEALSSSYTCVSIDLPHHGKSVWDDSGLTHEQTIVLIRDLMQRNGVSKVSLLGYSLGGRVCLKLAELLPESIDKIVLIASDGLRFNSFYYFLTRTISGKILFKSFLNNPQKYSIVIKAARKLGMVNELKYSFAMRYIHAAEDRAFLLKVWPCMSLLIPDMDILKQNVQKHRIGVGLFMGRYDNIIPVTMGESFKSYIPSCELVVVDKGHKVIDADTIPLIAKFILRP